MPVFLVIVFTMLALWFAYLGRRLVIPLPLESWEKVGLWALLGLPFALMAWIPAVYWRRRSRKDEPDAGESRLLAFGYFSLAFLSFLFFFVLLRDIVLLVTMPFADVSRLFTLPVSGALVALAAAMVWVGNRIATGPPRIKKVRVPIDNLPAAFEGFRLAQVSDIHVGRNIRKDFVSMMVKRVNDLGADLIAITGDLVDGSVDELREHVQPLADLAAKEGTYYVTGNHEYYWGGSAWVAEVKRLGIMPLLNAHRVIERGGAKLVLAGVPDLWAARTDDGPGPDAGKAISGAPVSDVRILLAHQPLAAKGAGAEKFHLQLSGHTHGGQFLPWTIFIRLFQPFVRGLIRYRGRWIYVNPGTGYWGPPVRLGSPSEITLLTLVRA